jgi:hypothetical protein
MKKHPLYYMATPEQKKILDTQYEEKLKELEERKKEKIELIKKEPYRSDSFKGFLQHIPSMVSGVEPEYLETDKWEDIMNTECVKRFGKHGKYFISAVGGSISLMVLSNINKETGKYKSWWVAGFLIGFTKDEIPLSEYKNMIEK